MTLSCKLGFCGFWSAQLGGGAGYAYGLSFLEVEKKKWEIILQSIEGGGGDLLCRKCFVLSVSSADKSGRC